MFSNFTDLRVAIGEPTKNKISLLADISVFILIFFSPNWLKACGRVENEPNAEFIFPINARCESKY